METEQLAHPALAPGPLDRATDPPRGGHPDTAGQPLATEGEHDEMTAARAGAALIDDSILAPPGEANRFRKGEPLQTAIRFRPFRRNQFQLAWKKAFHYMEFPAGGESIKSVGKTLQYARKSYDGIIHLMPFTCMPELVAQTIIARISRDYRLPVLTLIYDEHTSSTGLQTRLEAFIDLLAHHRYG